MVTASQNLYNRGVPRQSKSGHKYVHTCRKTGHFIVRIGSKCYGTYETLGEAIAIRDSYIKTH